MSEVEALRARRQEVLAELAGLERLRRGSVVEQYVERVGRDGTRRRRGPYPLYTYKRQGRTVSRRLHSAAEADQCRAAIARFRRFRDLVEELVQLGEKLSEAVPAGAAAAQKKTPWSRGRNRRR